jgi:flagellin-like hook-associated protein FlgL
MVTILSNVSALAASRQLGVSKVGLNTAITRLTTGRRVNNAADDSAALTAGNTAQAAQRKAAAKVYGDNASYFQAQQTDGAEQQNTQLAYRMAEMEGAGTTGDAEYTAYAANTSLGTDSTAALAAIAARQVTNAAAMSSAQSSAQLDGIEAESQQGIADAWLGADMGAEMANLTKYQILMQAGTSALNNANQSAQSVMKLFQ